MTQEIKDEAIEQLELDIKFGFENEEELFESIREMFEDDFNEEWFRDTIAEKFNQHQKDSLSWTKPTDFDRLATSFDELIQQKIVCLHNAGFTNQDGEDDCIETIERLGEFGVNAIGFCFYHSQDLAGAVDPEIKKLLLSFNAPTQNDNEALKVANKIIATLKRNGFEVSWSGTVDQKLEVKNIKWQKTPDNQEWGAERVIQILTRPQNGKKPFWKLW